jgi:hypothetical protein
VAKELAKEAMLWQCEGKLPTVSTKYREATLVGARMKMQGKPRCEFPNLHASAQLV